jgi:hypothetical protein
MVLAALAALALAGTAPAQSLEPRAYANTPVGMNFALLGYAFANGDVAFDASLPLKNGKVELNGAFLAYARSLDFLGKSAKVDVELPWAYASGSAEFNGQQEGRRVNGLGDARARFSINLYGAPALSLEDFPSYDQDLIVGASLQVTAPIGQYDAERLLNVGSHRWAFKPELGISKNWSPFILEISASGTFYTDNRDFFGGHDRAQNPIGSAQGHAIYSFRSGIWGSIDFTYYAGGKTLIDGVANHGVLSNTRLGGTLAIPVNRWNSIKLFGSSGISARTGGKFDGIGIAWQVRWGGGL